MSDPAHIIVKEVIAAGFTVCTLPGATAFLPALVSSGLETATFHFIGFLPNKTGERDKQLQRLASETATLIFYSPPHDLFKFLDLLYTHFGDRNIVIAREISKLFETYYRNRITHFLQNKNEIVLKGEFTVVCEGSSPKISSDSEIIERLQQFINKGETQSFAVNLISKELQVPKNRVYKLALEMNNIDSDSRSVT